MIQKIFELYIPGPVIGLILLLLTLRFVKNLGNDFFQKHIEGDLIRNSEYILSHLPLLFVPIGVGVVMHITYLEENLLEVLAIIFLGTILTIIFTAFMMDKLQNPKKKRV